MAEAWPTEAMSTAAVEAAAKSHYENMLKAHPGAEWLVWEDVHPVEKRNFKESILPLIWAALQALPDPRAAAWDEGFNNDYEGDGWPPNPYREATDE